MTCPNVKRIMTDVQADHVRALAIRKVQTVSSTGSSDSFRVRVNLELEVTKVRPPLLSKIQTEEVLMRGRRRHSQVELLHLLLRPLVRMRNLQRRSRFQVR